MGILLKKNTKKGFAGIFAGFLMLYSPRLAGLPAPIRATSGVPEDRSITVVGVPGQLPLSITPASSWL